MGKNSLSLASSLDNLLIYCPNWMLLRMKMAVNHRGAGSTGTNQTVLGHTSRGDIPIRAQAHSKVLNKKHLGRVVESL